MKRIGSWILSLMFTVSALSADFVYTHLSKDMPNNNRYPGICENSKGERLAIFRSGNKRGMLYTYFKDGTWSKSAPIPRQEVLDGDYLGSDIVVDSEDRFHVVWELMEELVYYATFQDGVWTGPVEVPWPARYEGFQICMDIRSNDELALVTTCKYAGRYKDIAIGFRKKGESNFSRFMNLTDDRESSSTPAVAADANDHLWVAYKGEVFGLEKEVLRACVIHLNRKDVIVDRAQPSENDSGYAFLEWIAANKINGLVMATWWQGNAFRSSWYDPATRKWSPPTAIGVGAPRRKFTMWNKVVAQGNDFYCLARDGGDILHIVKFNGETRSWENPIPVYNERTFSFDLYPSNGNILIVFSTYEDPSQVYFTSMVGSYEPPKIRVKSAVNVQVTTEMERSFFSGFYINHITWENNPWNIEREVEISYFNLYRKLKTEPEYGETPYQAQIPATQFFFDDKSGIGETPLYDYAVTCVTMVNDEPVESEIEY